MSSTQKNVPWVYGAVISPVFDYCKSIDLPVTAYLESNHLPPEPEAICQGVVPYHRFSTFMESLARATGVISFNQDVITYANQRKLEWDYGSLLEPTLYLALKQTITLIKGQSSEVFRLVNLGNGLVSLLFSTNTELPNEEELQVGLFSIQILIDLLQDYMGYHWQPTQMGIPGQLMGHSGLKLLAPQAEFFPLDRYWRLDLPRAALALSPRSQQWEHQRFPKEESSAIKDPTFPRVCRQILQTYLRTDQSTKPLTLQETAEILELTPRTLQRWLQESNKKFSQVFDEACFSIAKEMLKDTTLPIADIAHHLAYKSASNFSRSFRRVAGLSPVEYRKIVLSRQRS